MANEVIEAEVQEENGLQLPSLAAGSQLGTHGEIEARRAAIETLARVQVARAFPRGPQMKGIEKELEVICSDPIFAEKAIYAKPAGKDKQGNPQFIYGPSVFLAEEIAQNYPNYEVKPMIFGARGEQTDCEVQIWDMEKNTRFPSPFAVTHWTWDGYNKRAYLETNPQKIRQMVHAELSKVKRNLIFATTPKLLQRKCYEWCEATNRQSETALLKDRKNMMLYFSEKLEVTEEQILNYLKRKTKDEIEAKDVRLLRALVQSFKQGDVKPSDIWESAKNIPVKGDAVAAATAAETEPAAEKQKNAKPKASGSTGGTKQTSAVGSTSKDTNTQQTAEASQSESSSEENQQSSTKSPSETQSESQGSDTSSTAKSAPSESTSAEPKEKPKPNALDKPTPDQVAAMEEAFK